MLGRGRETLSGRRGLSSKGYSAPQARKRVPAGAAAEEKREELLLQRTFERQRKTINKERELNRSRPRWVEVSEKGESSGAKATTSGPVAQEAANHRTLKNCILIKVISAKKE